MNTVFWGGDGWKLLGSIAYNYPTNPTIDDKKKYLLFFNSLKDVLPCIYCRNSYSEYIIELPIDDFLDNNVKLSLWLYKIHNKVNNKLRIQGFLHESDPTFKHVFEYYKKYVKEINDSNCLNMCGFNFIYSIIFNFEDTLSEIKDINRISSYYIFIKTLSDNILPFKLANQIFNTYKYSFQLEDLYKQNFLKHYIYNIEKELNKTINCRCVSFKSKCKFILQYKVGCKKKTCR